MNNFIIINGIVRYQPGITKYQQCDIAKKAKEIIASKSEVIKKMKEINDVLAQCDLSRSQMLDLIMSNIFDESKAKI